jgi:transcription termination factor NusB
MHEVLDVKALGEWELPEEYLMQLPHCYLEVSLKECCLVIHLPKSAARENFGCFRDYKWQENADKDIITIKEGEKYTVSFFAEIIQLINRCGENLKRINENIEEYTKDWKGDTIWKI